MRSGFALPRSILRFPHEARKAVFRTVSVLDTVRRRLMDEPYWYLEALGVLPSRQGEGIGGLLVRSVIRLAEDQGVACYLETANARNVAFYEGHGFQVLHEQSFPETSLRLWAMATAAR
jgi:ribosomal protein S18 acetylase RimI-like enzyme